MLDIRSASQHLKELRSDLTDAALIDAGRRIAKRVCKKSLAWRVDITGTMTAHSASQSLTVPNQTVGADTVTCEPVTLLRLQASQDGINFQDLHPYPAYLQDTRMRVVETETFPLWWVDRMGTFELIPAPDQGYSYVATAGISPTGDFEKVALPTTAEDLLLEGMMSEIFLLPGSGMNEKLHEYHKLRYLEQMAEFLGKVMATSGVLRLRSPRLGERTQFYGTRWLK